MTNIYDSSLIVKQQYLFVTCRDDKFSFQTRELGSVNAISCNRDETMTVMLQSFSTTFDQYLVNDTNNTIIINGITFTMPNGSGSYSDQAQIFNNLDPDYVTCDYNFYRNTFVFTSQHKTPFLIQFPTGGIWGMADGEQFNIAPEQSFESRYNLGLLKPNTIILRENSLNLNGDNYELLNLESGNGISNIFHVIPIEFKAHLSVTYVNVDKEFEHALVTKSLDGLNFDITDYRGNNIDWLRDYFAVIKIKTYKNYDGYKNNVLRYLQESNRLWKKMYFLKGMKEFEYDDDD